MTETTDTLESKLTIDPMMKYSKLVVEKAPDGKKMSVVVYYMEGLDKHRDMFGTLRYEYDNYFEKMEQRYQWAMDYALKKIKEVE